MKIMTCLRVIWRGYADARTGQPHDWGSGRPAIAMEIVTSAFLLSSDVVLAGPAPRKKWRIWDSISGEGM